MAIDLNATRHNGLCVITAVTPAAKAWLSDHVPTFEPGFPVVAEDRYAPDILLGAHNCGLTVRLDGRIANARRTKS